jgi:ketosteroid isomerase-like protein
MFDAFNRCDATAMAGFFTADMEFYHDWGGQVGPRDRFIAGFADGCRKGEVGRRELVGRMEVHALRNVGALQIGAHRFFVRNADGTERPGSIARLVTLWRREDGVWRATRVFSFDHRAQR